MRYRIHRKRGGEISAAAMPFAAPILGAHKALQTIAPVRSLVGLTKQIGVQKDIRNLLNKSKIGRQINRAGTYLQKKLGYGGARMVKVYLHRRRHRGGRRRRHRRSRPLMLMAPVVHRRRRHRQY